MADGHVSAFFRTKWEFLNDFRITVATTRPTNRLLIRIENSTKARIMRHWIVKAHIDDEMCRIEWPATTSHPRRYICADERQPSQSNLRGHSCPFARVPSRYCTVSNRFCFDKLMFRFLLNGRWWRHDVWRRAISPFSHFSDRFAEILNCVHQKISQSALQHSHVTHTVRCIGMWAQRERERVLHIICHDTLDRSKFYDFFFG